MRVAVVTLRAAPILSAALEQATNLMQDHAVTLKQIVVDPGLRGVDADNPNVEIIHRGKRRRSDRRSSKHQRCNAHATGRRRRDSGAMAVGTSLDRPDLVAPAPAYLIGGRRFATDAPGFVEAIAAKHGAQAPQHRPRCLCLVGGVEMYVARPAGSNEGFIVKRMPGTGSRHAPDCPSYEPTAEFSGLGQVLRSAIDEDPATGETALRLDFPMSKIAGRSVVPAAGGCGDSVTTNGTRLSLRRLLHFLWDQAGLTHWKPGFAGKRSWTTVRRHLLQAAENKIARGDALKARLYIPEVFSVEQRDAIDARRIAQWAHAVA